MKQNTPTAPKRAATVICTPHTQRIQIGPRHVSGEQKYITENTVYLKIVFECSTNLLFNSRELISSGSCFCVKPNSGARQKTLNGDENPHGYPAITIFRLRPPLLERAPPSTHDFMRRLATGRLCQTQSGSVLRCAPAPTRHAQIPPAYTQEALRLVPAQPHAHKTCSGGNTPATVGAKAIRVGFNIATKQPSAGYGHRLQRFEVSALIALFGLMPQHCP